jgi:hypothetical protein
MRKNMLIIFLLLIACIFISKEAFSAWTQPKGHSYNQLTLSYYRTVDKFTTLQRDEHEELVSTDGSVHKVPQEEFISTKITYYGEYGITDKITIFTSIPYDWQRSNDTMRYANVDGPSGIGDINLGLRHSLIDNILGSGILMSVQGEVKIPEAYDYEHPLEKLSLGDGQYDFKLALLFGRGLGKGYAWLNAGYKWRFENNEFEDLSFEPSDQIKVSMGGGYAITSWLSIRGILDWTNSVGNAEVSDALIDANAKAVGSPSKSRRDLVESELILDTLGLEPNALSGGIDLAFTITPKIQTVVSYNVDLRGIGDFGTKNFSQGTTVGIALVYLH